TAAKVGLREAFANAIVPPRPIPTMKAGRSARPARARAAATAASIAANARDVLPQPKPRRPTRLGPRGTARKRPRRFASSATAPEARIGSDEESWTRTSTAEAGPA